MEIRVGIMPGCAGRDIESRKLKIEKGEGENSLIFRDREVAARKRGGNQRRRPEAADRKDRTTGEEIEISAGLRKTLTRLGGSFGESDSAGEPTSS